MKEDHTPYTKYLPLLRPLLCFRQVARRSSPAEDAAAVAAVRKAVGERITIRADANRRWNLEEATAFGLAVKGLDLQYVEVSGRTWIC